MIQITKGRKDVLGHCNACSCVGTTYINVYEIEISRGENGGVTIRLCGDCMDELKERLKRDEK